MKAELDATFAGPAGSPASDADSADACPRHDDLTQWINGDAPLPIADRISAHVSICTHCQAEIDVIRKETSRTAATQHIRQIRKLRGGHRLSRSKIFGLGVCVGIATVCIAMVALFLPTGFGHAKGSNAPADSTARQRQHSPKVRLDDNRVRLGAPSQSIDLEQVITKFANSMQPDVYDFTQSLRSSSNPDPELADATTAFLSGRYSEAAAKYEAFLLKFPDDAQVWYNLGRAYAQMESWSSAVAALEKAKNLDDLSLWHSLAVAYAQDNKFFLSEQAFQQALRFESASALVIADSGRLYARMNAWDKAESAFRRAVDRDAFNANTWFDLGVACFHTKNAADEESAYRRALLVDPNHAKSHYNLGVVTMRQGSAFRDQHNAQAADRAFNEAAEHFSRVIDLAPTAPECYYNRGVVRVLISTDESITLALSDFKQAFLLESTFRRRATELAKYLNAVRKVDPQLAARLEEITKS